MQWSVEITSSRRNVMAKKFSADEARVKSETAQKALKERRRKNLDIKKQTAKDLKNIQMGFERQRERIISAAIDGEKCAMMIRTSIRG